MDINPPKNEMLSYIFENLLLTCMIIWHTNLVLALVSSDIDKIQVK